MYVKQNLKHIQIRKNAKNVCKTKSKTYTNSQKTKNCMCFKIIKFMKQ